RSSPEPVPRAPPSPPAAPVRDQAFSVSQFRGYHPATFNGQGDPRLVDVWLRSLDMIFEVMDCLEPHRIMCAQLQMIGDAGLWWHSYWEMRPEEKLALTWAGLKALLREKYYPAHYRERMERQFLALEQGARTIDEYERDFTRLGFFVPYLIDTEETRARRFKGGLRGENLLGSIYRTEQ
ncbi:Unknown protein, partial [Striga hermonthica]